jgi:hypothetical protein
MGTDLPYAAEAEMTLSPDELEVCQLHGHTPAKRVRD